MEQNLKSENHYKTYYHALNNLNIEKLKELSTNSIIKIINYLNINLIKTKT